MARLAPLPEAEWSEDTRKAIAAVPGRSSRYSTTRGGPSSVVCTIAHNPGLVALQSTWAGTLALKGALDRQLAELLTLRTAWLCQSDFEWGHHAEYAEHFGMTPQEIDRIPEGPEAAGWTDQQRLLLRAADELHVDSKISDATWTALAVDFSPGLLIEIIVTVGQYTMLSMVTNAFEIDIDEGVRRLADAR